MKRKDVIDSIKTAPDRSVLIIGGGINGIGTFRDLALQGVDVILVEQNDFGSGASAASSHMLHGGIRYLENGEFRLVREALRERNLLLQNAPHYAKPLPTTIPIFSRFSGLLNAPLKFLGLLNKPAERGGLVIGVGLRLYDAYTRNHRMTPTHEFLNRADSLKAYPDLNPQIVSTATYYDAWMPYPERICLELVLEAEQAEQARALNYVSAVDAQDEEVVLRDELSGETFHIRPKIVINAAGPWIDFANRGLGQETNFIGGTKGSHLILHHPELIEATQGHEFFFENHDGRIVLIFPFIQDRLIVGTTDIRIDDPDEAVTTEEEIDYILGMLPRVFPNITVERSHIVFTFSGVRPLPA
ncbi:MAG: FAD-dependent oxidoreductase, partial [Chloroflexi bacterium]|nr:FAD-dependent oxidoreductase [Chloroflexota bacterium]